MDRPLSPGPACPVHPTLELLRRALLRPTGPPVKPDELLRRGFLPPRSRWRRWLAWQAGFRRGPIGDLARAAEDLRLPDDPRRVVRHLRQRGPPRWQLERARTAVAEFRDFEDLLR